ncbi:hypothetical protein SAMD00023353_0202070 [Rosellinia necatrix]|uniref:Uncharacterized protein n=1 Tax=Rosellinia necatrix TaxID=77044 RepID=A0A1S7UJK1_ROSNE|nr:hypothetical protein SAMD00023353_0202070 [Rosellinia necatrix]
MDDAPIVPVTAPWQLKGTVYSVTFFSQAGKLPDHAYSPLERDSPYSSAAASGEHRGGISQFQVIRYTESPVGPYDELIVCPGSFNYEVEEGGRRKRKVKKDLRISRIYVSQKYTCWNGRTNWNIPKHLARFEWDDLGGGGTGVRVYPHDTTGDSSELRPNTVPLFQATFKPMRWTPSFPFSVSWLRYVGLGACLVQPPLPEGQGSQGELPGTERWCKIVPGQATKRASLAWADLSQRDERGEPVTSVAHENFWPGLGRWQIALKLDDAVIDFDDGIHWDAPRTKL